MDGAMVVHVFVKFEVTMPSCKFERHAITKQHWVQKWKLWGSGYKNLTYKSDSLLFCEIWNDSAIWKFEKQAIIGNIGSRKAIWDIAYRAISFLLKLNYD